jgi:hypothetical protein
MVKHIILWTLRADMTADEKQRAAQGMKKGLEGLAGKIDGLVDIKVVADGRLSTSNADVMLDSTLKDFDSLKAYAVHPLHVDVADRLVRPFTAQRTCLDYEV